MARPIKETPILFGEDARRFEQRMKEVRRVRREKEDWLITPCLWRCWKEGNEQGRKAYENQPDHKAPTPIITSYQSEII